ncbi:hypothetical protein EXIGLDRAFT_829089 [Exidia glandulosa HHB12029]|uniref:G-protein coupled receptors family 1 profile domain-containing protein n=1 Tax=Exidia glandulosa HHB12029 TaxID=1314781 RepID=A0A165PR36_EXIGL|nr:hypothetical protein EXIGLDRAFT_829089 [Exidia glandulosa HHB12029]
MAAVSLTPEARRLAISTYSGVYLTGSHVLIPLLLGIMLSKRTLRHPLLVNMCIASILNGIAALLIFYANGYDHPFPRTLCLLQAALMWSSAPMLAATDLMLVWHTWLTVRASIVEQAEDKPKRLRLDPMYLTTMILFPYILLVFFAMAAAATLGAHHEEVTLERRVLYCAVAHGAFSVFVSGVNAAILLLTLCVEVLLGRALWRAMARHQWCLCDTDRDEPFDVCFALRVFWSGIYLLVSCGFAIFAVVKASVIPDIFEGTVAIFVALIFGIRWTVWNALVDLVPWRRRRGVTKEAKTDSDMIMGSSR